MPCFLIFARDNLAMHALVWSTTSQHRPGWCFIC